MRVFNRLSSILAIVTLTASAAAAQTAPDPSGHWEGAVETPNGEIVIELDLVKTGAGALSGTLGTPGQLKGVPLQSASIDGRTMTLAARSDQPLRLTLAEDGTSMSGRLQFDVAAFPATFTRIGAPQLQPAPRSTGVQQLEGRWTATLASGPAQYRLVLAVARQADGTAVAAITNLDEGGLTIPVVLARDGATVNVSTSALAMSYAGALSADGRTLSGTFNEGGGTVPLTFVRAD